MPGLLHQENVGPAPSPVGVWCVTATTWVHRPLHSCPVLHWERFHLSQHQQDNGTATTWAAAWVLV
jgi:hypothetical protein